MAAVAEEKDREVFFEHPARSISRAAKLFGTSKLTGLRDCEVWHDAVLRADLAPIAIGIDSIIGAATVIRPPVSAKTDAGFVSVSIGSHTALGSGVVCEAAEIGSNVVIGDGVILVRYTRWDLHAKLVVTTLYSVVCGASLNNTTPQGPRSRVLDGARVTAGSVVPADTVIPPFAVASGAPARISHSGLAGVS